MVDLLLFVLMVLVFIHYIFCNMSHHLTALVKRLGLTPSPSTTKHDGTAPALKGALKSTPRYKGRPVSKSKLSWIKEFLTFKNRFKKALCGPTISFDKSIDLYVHYTKIGDIPHCVVDHEGYEYNLNDGLPVALGDLKSRVKTSVKSYESHRCYKGIRNNKLGLDERRKRLGFSKEEAKAVQDKRICRSKKAKLASEIQESYCSYPRYLFEEKPYFYGSPRFNSILSSTTKHDGAGTRPALKSILKSTPRYKDTPSRSTTKHGSITCFDEPEEVGSAWGDDEMSDGSITSFDEPEEVESEEVEPEEVEHEDVGSVLGDDEMSDRFISSVDEGILSSDGVDDDDSSDSDPEEVEEVVQALRRSPRLRNVPRVDYGKYF